MLIVEKGVRTFVQAEAGHERLDAIDTEVGLPGTRSYGLPQVLSGMYVIRPMTLTFDGCYVRIDSIELLGLKIGGSGFMAVSGKPCIEFAPLTNLSVLTREKTRVRVAELLGVETASVLYLEENTMLVKNVDITEG